MTILCQRMYSNDDDYTFRALCLSKIGGALWSRVRTVRLDFYWALHFYDFVQPTEVFLLDAMTSRSWSASSGYADDREWQVTRTRRGG